MPSASDSLQTIYRLKVWLCDVEPFIWRRLEVPAAIPLPKLHRAIQVAMGWEDYHLHEFQIGHSRYEVPDPEDLYGRKGVDERRVKLETVVEKVGTEFEYRYDFGDGWAHKLRLEEIILAEANAFYPRCLAGQRSGPPEDVGGPYGYAAYLEALADPRHRRHRELLEWRGPFDSEHFDLAAINNDLNKEFSPHVRWPSPKP